MTPAARLRLVGTAITATFAGLAAAPDRAGASSLNLQDLLDGQSLACSSAGDVAAVAFQGFWESIYPEISDTVLGFDVYVTDPRYLITGVTLDMDQREQRARHRDSVPQHETRDLGRVQDAHLELAMTRPRSSPRPCRRSEGWRRPAT